MKSKIFTPFIIALALLVFIPNVYSADPKVCTIIDVYGRRYSDRMWLITYPGTTPGFDNGWDGTKMFGSPLTPQIFAIGSDYNYQISTSASVHEAVIGFIPGEDSEYTLLFSHYDISFYYQQLYLVDLLENKTIDIYANGFEYKFTSQASDPRARFKVLTSLPQVEPVIPEEPVVEEPVIEEPVVVTPEEPVVEEPVVVIPEEPVVEEPVVTPEDPKGKKDPKDKKDKKDKKLKVVTSGKTIVVDNPSKHKGHLKVMNATTGKLVKNLQFNADGITTLSTDIASGLYIVNGVTEDEAVTTTIVVY